MPVSLKLGKITSLYLGGEHSPILMKFRSTVFCPMIPLLASGAKCLWRVGFSLNWHGLLSLLGRTLPAKMAHLATRETLFICRIVSIRINPFSHSLGEAPLRGFSSRSMLCLLCSFVSENSYLAQPPAMLWEALWAKWGNSWALGGANGGGGNHHKSERDG